jgi:hypothetical protein
MPLARWPGSDRAATCSSTCTTRPSRGLRSDPALVLAADALQHEGCSKQGVRGAAWVRLRQRWNLTLRCQARAP